MEPLSEKEFYSTYTDIFYKTSNSEFGKYKTQIPFGKSFGKNSTFTTVIRTLYLFWEKGHFDIQIQKYSFLEIWVNYPGCIIFPYTTLSSYSSL